MLYQHLCSVYPSIDPNVILDTVFIEAAQRIRSAPSSRTDLWLLGIARGIICRRQRGVAWLEDNALAVVDTIRTTAGELGDWHLWTDTERIITLIGRLSAADQEILRLVSCIDGLDARQLATILGVRPRRAARQLERVTGAFRQAYGDEDALDEPGGEQ
jgi:DNA-directed RNA polymerase specialized sigma24 family protein